MKKIIAIGLIAIVFFVSLASLINNPTFNAIQNTNSQVHVKLTHEATTIYTIDAFNRTGAQYLDTEGNETLIMSLLSSPPWMFGFGDAYCGLSVNATGYLYVVGYNTDHVIEIYDSNGNYIGGWGNLGVEDWEFDNPAGIEIDTNGDVYIVDRDHYHVKQFTAGGTFIRKTYCGGNLWDVAVDDDLDRFYFGTNDMIKAYDQNGTYLFNFSASVMDGVGGLAVNSTGYIYAIDSMLYKTFVFDSDGTYIMNQSTNGVSGQFLTVNATDYIYQTDHFPNKLSAFSKDCQTFLCNSTTFVTELQGIAIYNGVVYVAALDGYIRTFNQVFQNITPAYVDTGSYESILYTPYSAGNGTINSIHFACDIPSDSDLELHGYVSLDNGSTWLYGMALPINDNDTSPLEFTDGFCVLFYVNFTASSDSLETPAFFWLELNYTYTAQNVAPHLGDIDVSFDNETLEATISVLITDPDNDTLDVTLCLPLGTIIDNETDIVNGTTVVFLYACEYEESYEFYINVTDSEDDVQSSLFGFETGKAGLAVHTATFDDLFIAIGACGFVVLIATINFPKRRLR